MDVTLECPYFKSIPMNTDGTVVLSGVVQLLSGHPTTVFVRDQANEMIQLLKEDGTTDPSWYQYSQQNITIRGGYIRRCSLIVKNIHRIDTEDEANPLAVAQRHFEANIVRQSNFGISPSLPMLANAARVCTVPAQGCLYGTWNAALCRCDCLGQYGPGAGYCPDSSGVCVLLKSVDGSVNTYLPCAGVSTSIVTTTTATTSSVTTNPVSTTVITSSSVATTSATSSSTPANPTQPSGCAVPTAGCLYGSWNQAQCRCECLGERGPGAGYCRDSNGRCTGLKLLGPGGASYIDCDEPNTTSITDSSSTNQVTSGTSTTTTATTSPITPTSTATPKLYKTAVLLFYCLDSGGPSQAYYFGNDLSKVNSILFNDPLYGMNPQFLVQSYGQAQFVGAAGTSQVDAFGPFPINYYCKNACNSFTWEAAVNKAFVDKYGYDYQDVYDRYMYLYPNAREFGLSNCGWGGQAYMPGKLSRSYMEYAFTPNATHVVGHELGHNFGMDHSNKQLCSGLPRAASPALCTSEEYADTQEGMGSGIYWKYLNFEPYHKGQASWMLPQNTLEVWSSGIYTLDYLHSNDRQNKIFTIRIPLLYQFALKTAPSQGQRQDTFTHLYLEYSPQQYSYYDATVPNSHVVFARYANTYDVLVQSQLFDTGILGYPGAEYVDDYQKISVRLLTSSPGQSATVQIDFKV